MTELAYAFAKKSGVVVLSTGERIGVGLREGADPAALGEVRRALGKPIDVQALSRQAFDRKLSEIYGGADRAVHDFADLVGLFVAPDIKQARQKL